MNRDSKLIKLLFELFFLVCLIDPFSLLFNLKNPIWILLILLCIFKYGITKIGIIPIIVTFLCITLSFFSGVFQDNVKDIDKLYLQYRAILPPLILILWSKRLNLLPLYERPVIITSVIVVILFFIIESNPGIRILLNELSSDSEKNIVTSNSEIEYLGVTFPMFYWGSLPSFTIVLGVVMYKLFLDFKLKYILYSIIVSITFFISGSRVPMLIPFACLYFISYYYIRRNKNVLIKYLFYFLPIILGIALIFIIYLLASDVTQSSNAAKYGHYYSYGILFSNHPEYLFLGQGIGSSFYTMGFGKMTDITELTYFEILRVYGLLSIPLMLVILFPIFKLWKYRKYGMIYTIIWSYIIFLVSAGTNPKLLNTAGMIVVLVMYSTVYNINLIRK